MVLLAHRLVDLPPAPRSPRALKPSRALKPQSLRTTVITRPMQTMLSLPSALIRRPQRLDERVPRPRLIRRCRLGRSMVISECASHFLYSCTQLFNIRSSVTRLHEDLVADAAGAPAHLTRYVPIPVVTHFIFLPSFSARSKLSRMEEILLHPPLAHVRRRAFLCCRRSPC